MRLEHVAFNVEDVKALAAWYVANLDMEIVRSVAAPPFIHFLADKPRKTLIEVYSDPDGSVIDYGAHHPVTFHLAFAVEDMEAARSRLVAAGGRLDGDVYGTPAGDRLVFVRDPWGNTVQLVQRVTRMID